MTDIHNMELLARINKVALSVVRVFLLTHLLFY